MKTTYSITGGGINDNGFWVYYCRNDRTQRVVEKRKKEVAQLRREGRITGERYNTGEHPATSTDGKRAERSD